MGDFVPPREGMFGVNRVTEEASYRWEGCHTMWNRSGATFWGGHSMWHSLGCWLYWLMGTEKPLDLSPWAKGLRHLSQDEAHFPFCFTSGCHLGLAQGAPGSLSGHHGHRVGTDSPCNIGIAWRGQLGEAQSPWAITRS